MIPSKCLTDSNSHAPKLLDRLKCESKMKQWKSKESGTCFLICSTLGQRGMLELQDGIRKKDKHLIIPMDLHKTKKQVG